MLTRAHARTHNHAYLCALVVCITRYNGGILYMMDVLGKPLLDTTVTATNKLWWPQCEALYATMLAYV